MLYLELPSDDEEFKEVFSETCQQDVHNGAKIALELVKLCKKLTLENSVLEREKADLERALSKVSGDLAKERERAYAQADEAERTNELLEERVRSLSCSISDRKTRNNALADLRAEFEQLSKEKKLAEKQRDEEKKRADRIEREAKKAGVQEEKLENVVHRVKVLREERNKLKEKKKDLSDEVRILKVHTKSNEVYRHDCQFHGPTAKPSEPDKKFLIHKEKMFGK